MASGGLLVAALDGAAPAWTGRFTRFGTPFAINLTSGVVSSVFCVLVSTLTYLLVFPALIVLRRKYPNLPRPYRVPGGAGGVSETM